MAWSNVNVLKVSLKSVHYRFPVHVLQTFFNINEQIRFNRAKFQKMFLFYRDVGLLFTLWCIFIAHKNWIKQVNVIKTSSLLQISAQYRISTNKLNRGGGKLFSLWIQDSKFRTLKTIYNSKHVESISISLINIIRGNFILPFRIRFHWNWTTKISFFKRKSSF